MLDMARNYRTGLLKCVVANVLFCAENGRSGEQVVKEILAEIYRLIVTKVKV